MANVTVIQPTISVGQDEKIRCAAYCRVSSPSDDQLNSFSVQMTYYAHKFECSDTETLVEIYADEGISGTSMTKRDEFQRMLNDCRQGKIDRIYTKSISRFARNTHDCLKTVRELKSLGITIKFEKEGYDTAQMTDEIMLTVMGSLAQEESVSISQNMRWSIQKRMENGTYTVSTIPYGYQKVRGEIVIDDAEAGVVREIFRMYLSGTGSESIALRLNTSDIPHTDGKWTASAVRYVLSNEKYIGDSLLRKFYTTETVPFRCVRNHGQQDQFYFSDDHPAIVSRDDFEIVQRLLQERGAGNHRSNVGTRNFSKKLFCGVCGTAFKYKLRAGGAHWVCRKHDDSAASCPTKQMPEQSIMRMFVQMYNKLLFSYKDVLVPLQKTLMEVRLRRLGGNQTAMEMHREIAKLLEQTHVIARLHTKGFLDDSKYLEQSTELKAKIARLRTKQKKLNQADASDEMIDQIEIMIAHFSKQEKPIAEFDADVFHMMVEKVTVTQEHDLIFHLIGGLQLTEKQSAL